MEIDEREESQVSDTGQIFNDVIEEKFPKLGKDNTYTDTRSTQDTKKTKLLNKISIVYRS